MTEHFIGEAIQPVPGTFEAAGPASGEPALPGRFLWRGEEYEVVEVLEKWKQSGPMRGGGSERYLRKHWFRIRTRCGRTMKLYFDRQPMSKGQPKQRWFLSVIEEG